MSKYRNIQSFNDLRVEKERLKLKILIEEKTLEIKTLEIKHELEPARLISSLVNKLLASFFS